MFLAAVKIELGHDTNFQAGGGSDATLGAESAQLHDMKSDEPLAAKDIQHVTAAIAEVAEHDTLKYHLLGPSLTKAGQDSVDQQKVRSGVLSLDENFGADGCC